MSYLPTSTPFPLPPSNTHYKQLINTQRTTHNTQHILSNVKTYIKLSNYLHSNKQYEAAKVECDKGLKLDPSSTALLNNKKKVKLAIKNQPKKIDKSNKDYVSIYPERTQKNGSSLELLRQLKFELGSGKASKTHTGLKGMFSRLMDPKLFQATVFPGLSEAAR